MPDETLEKAENTSRDNEMERVSETPLTLEMEETAKEKPLAYAKYIARDTKTFFGKSIALCFSVDLSYHCKIVYEMNVYECNWL